MVWFKVDDKLHSHRKAMRAGVEAMGLWVLAGSWSADQQTNGFVPHTAAVRLTPHAHDLAKDLVGAGLWFEGDQDGEEGWWFHEWRENGQPTKEDVEKKRADLRERQRRFRAKGGRYGSFEDRPEDGNALPTGDERVGNSHPDPTRPVRTPPGAGLGDLVVEDQREREDPHEDLRGTLIPSDFAVTEEMRRWLTKEGISVDVHAKTEEFVDYYSSLTGERAKRRNWEGMWRRWMRGAAERQMTKTRRPASGSDEKVQGWQALKNRGAAAIEGGSR